MRAANPAERSLLPPRCIPRPLRCPGVAGPLATRGFRRLAARIGCSRAPARRAQRHRSARVPPARCPDLAARRRRRAGLVVARARLPVVDDRLDGDRLCPAGRRRHALPPPARQGWPRPRRCQAICGIRRVARSRRAAGRSAGRLRCGDRCAAGRRLALADLRRPRGSRSARSWPSAPGSSGSTARERSPPLCASAAADNN